MISAIQKILRNTFAKQDFLIPPYLLDNPLLQGLEQEHFKEMAAMAEPVLLLAGEAVFTQDQEATHIYVIERGEVALIHYNERTEGRHIIRMGGGEILGESSLARREKYEYSAIAEQNTKLWRIPVKAMAKGLDGECKLAANITRLLGEQLHNAYAKMMETQNERLQLKKTQDTLTVFMTRVFVIFSVYILGFAVFFNISHRLEFISVISSAIIFLFTLISIELIKSTDLPVSFYGVTFKNWRYAVKDALIFTIPVIAIAVIAFKLLVGFYSFDSVVHVLRASSLVGGVGAAQPSGFNEYLIATRVIYFTLIPFQEFMVRGVLQSVMAFLVKGPYKNLTAILISNLIFAMLHVHGGLLIAGIAFIFGMFWGFLYARQKTLVGVILSHFMIGATAIFLHAF